jgi:serine phosphatase RsbU (regulator of sigma subunit)
MELRDKAFNPFNSLYDISLGRVVLLSDAQIEIRKWIESSIEDYKKLVKQHEEIVALKERVEELEATMDLIDSERPRD